MEPYGGVKVKPEPGDNNTNAEAITKRELRDSKTMSDILIRWKEWATSIENFGKSSKVCSNQKALQGNLK